MKTARLYVDGMYCAACGVEIERALHAVPGVETANVSSAEDCAVVSYDESRLSVSAIIERIRETGYSAMEYSYGSMAKVKEQKVKRLFQKVLLSLLMTAPLASGIPLPLKAVLATAVQFYIGAEFYRDAYYAIKNRTLNMSFMVAFSTTCIYLYSLTAFLRGDTGQIYFDSSALIITMVLTGRLIEARLNARTGSVLEQLHARLPQTARAVTDGKEELVELSALNAGSTIRIEEGERVPLDAVIVSGEALLDESMLTGEAEPKAKGPGDALFAGTRNTQGSCVAEVTADAEHTVLSGILSRISRSLSTKSHLQNLTDKAIRIFCPAVIGIALAAGLLWAFVLDPGNYAKALKVFVSAVVVACPCALGLAAPMSIEGAVNVAARNGILLKEAGVVESLAKVNSIGFDKTGTLTEGKFSVTDILLLDAGSADELMLHAAIAEKQSLHPLAAAILRYVGKGPKELPDADRIQSFPGKGVLAYWNGSCIAAGNLTFAAEQGAPPEDLDKIRAQLAGQSKSVVVVLKDGAVEGACLLQDGIRPDAKEALEQLQAAGVRCYMMTGDRKEAAEEAAAQLGMTEWYAELLPEQKAELLEEQQKQGAAAMVGDGLNDIATLCTADIGIELNNSDWLASDSANVAITSGALTKIPMALSIAKRAMHLVRQNLVLSCIYNVAALGVAVCGLLNPVIAAVAMSLSSVSVVLNSQRMRRWNP